MNEKILKKSMEIGALFEAKYNNDERTDWNATEGCAEFCRYIIEEAAVTKHPIRDVFLLSAEYYIGVINSCGADIKAHGWDEYCKGFLAGEILGMPTEENLKLVDEAEKLWEDTSYGYYQEVLNAVKKSFKKKKRIAEIEKSKQKAKAIEEVTDFLIEIIEKNDERFSFEWGSSGVETGKIGIFDKEKKISYVLKLEEIIYDENDEPINL